MTVFDELVRIFGDFPGIGPRQARRFVYHLLKESPSDRDLLSKLIRELSGVMSSCEMCQRYYAKNGGGARCNICSDELRDEGQLLIVERDEDITPIERSGVYRGLYFVFGGTVPLMNEPEAGKLHGGALKHIVGDRIKRGTLKEIILGFSVNPDGENTARYVRTLLAPLLEGSMVTVTMLGRGLSTGSELEYADPDTITYALNNRS